MNRAFDYIILILSVISSIVTILGFWLTINDKLDDPAKYGVIFLGIISLYFIISNIYFVSKYKSRTGYANAFGDLNLALTHIYTIDRNEESSERQKAKHITEELKHTCTHISHSFSSIKGHHVGVCIKLMAKADNSDDVEVITLCRDVKSEKKRPVHRDNAPKVSHRILNNTDFKFINEHIKERGCCYINNGIPFASNYQNTSLKGDELIYNDNLLVCWFAKFFLWPLSYKSTLVLPIVPLNVNERDVCKLRGFLCVDSDHLRAFNKNADFEIMQGVSDALYNKIDELYNLIDKQ